MHKNYMLRPFGPAFRVFLFGVAVAQATIASETLSDTSSEAALEVQDNGLVEGDALIVDSVENSRDIHFEPCEISLPGTAVSRKLECAVLVLPLVPDTEDAESDQRVPVSIVRLKAKSKDVAEDPVLMLAGGPGQAASEAYLFADRQFDKLSWNRDIYLIDQRGTGRSSKFVCEEAEARMFEAAGAQALLGETEALVNACLEAFEFDVRYFTTTAALADFEAVRERLGVTQWNLIGVSYGTRVAQQYLRQYPQSVRSVVLDSVVHPQHVLGTEIAQQSQFALDRVVQRCTEEESCNQAFPNLSEGVISLIKKLKTEPMSLVYENIRTGELVELDYTYAHLVLALRMSLYSDETFALIPLLLHEAYAKNNFAPLARKTDSIINQMKGMMAIGMHNTVMCTEDYPFLDLSEGEVTAAEESYLGRDLLDFLEQTCAVWPQGVIHNDFKKPLISSKPVLLLSGSEDPITPPSYADIAMQQLENAAHFVAPGQGHNVSVIGCAPTLLAKFVNELQPKQLDASCLQRLQASPFFIDFNGALP